MSIITLTTDFGLKDHYAASMKGVMLSINSGANIVDITHEIKPQDVEHAAYVILCAYPHFPANTIHVVVVDPGVGTSRNILVVAAFDQIFIGPDNGVFSYILDQSGSTITRALENASLFLPDISNTFHGRDIMAPVAARLSTGTSFESVGGIIENPVRLASIKPKESPGQVNGRIIHVDGFGNLVTNISEDMIRGWTLELRVGPIRLNSIEPAYANVPDGEYLAIIGSSGFVEIAKNQASAHIPDQLTRGTPVIIKNLTS